MMVWESIKIAVFSIYAHGLRSVLTMVGIVIGVASVITIVAIGQGGEAALKSNFTGSGNDTVDIEFQYDEDYDFGSDLSAVPIFTESDLLLLSKIPEIKQVMATAQSSAEARFRNETLNVQVIGIDEGYFDVYPHTVQLGRLLDEADIGQGRKVAVVNPDMAEELFQSEEAVGEYVEIEGVPFKVIGVAEETNNSIFRLGMSTMLVPRSVWPLLYGDDEISTLTVQAAGPESLETAGQKAVDLLNGLKQDRPQLQGEYFIFNLEQIQKSLSTISRIMTSIIGGIAGISLFVGGIGVMNIMLVSVTERTKEIGIRKALGATRGEILTQFLIEAALLTTIGGVAGIMLGYGGSYLASVLTKWPPVMSWQVIVGGVLFSMLIGIVFGILPANRAAKLMPIEALRYD
ncbi:ABC transporter permease [Paenibacillus thailandensis]|uniref:ABC transporter permease n=1 Tax=Paenibacillus thailandensis TaxID=393250 RepID=A0ABW5R229_9BACL